MFKGFFNDSLDGSESSYHISSVGEYDATRTDPSRAIPNVDERNFYPRSKSILPAVPKSLLKHNNISLMKGSGEDSTSLSQTSDASSVGTFASQLNTQDRTGAPKPIINALDAEHKFKINCYNSFKLLSNKSGGENGTNHGVYGHQLHNAMKHISMQIPSGDVHKLMKKLAISRLDVLCWKDFEMFAYTLFIPYFENKPIHLLGVGERGMGSVSSVSGTNAFQALMRKQRAASAATAFPEQYSSVITGSQGGRIGSGSSVSSADSRRPIRGNLHKGDPLSSYGKQVNKSVVFREGLILGENLDGLLVPQFELKEAMVDVVKFNERYARKQHHKKADKFATGSKKKKKPAATTGNTGEESEEEELNQPTIIQIGSPIVSYPGSSASSSVNGDPNRASPNTIASGRNSRNSVNSFGTGTGTASDIGVSKLSPSPNGSNRQSPSPNTSASPNMTAASPNATVHGSASPSPIIIIESPKGTRLQQLKPPPLVKVDSDANLTLEELEYKKFHHRLPTVKMKLNEISNKKVAYSTRWINMKKIRDSQNAAIERRAYLKSLKRDMTSFTIASEKEIIADRLNEQRAGSGSVVRQKMMERKRAAAVTKENVERWKEEEMERKKTTAAELSRALFASSTMSRSMLFEEQADRNAYKEGSIGRLSSYSSTKVEIPEMFDKAIAAARTQEAWDAAILAKRRYKEQILSDRIYDYTMAKSAAVLRNVRPMSTTVRGFGEPATPGRSMEFFTQTRHQDEDLISFDIEYAKYLGDSYSLPSLKPKVPDGEDDNDSIESADVLHAGDLVVGTDFDHHGGSSSSSGYRPVDSEELAEGSFETSSQAELSPPVKEALQQQIYFPDS